MSFHQCGGNIGDNINIPLPTWVLKAGEVNPNIFFTNKDGRWNKKFLTFGLVEKSVV
jgi:beta-amylase